MVDVVLYCVELVVEVDDVTDDGSEIVGIDGLSLEISLFHRLSESLVEAESSDSREVVSVSGKETHDELTRVVRGCEVSVSKTLVNLNVCVVDGLRGVFRERCGDNLVSDLVALEVGEDLLVGLCTKNSKERGYHELSLSVDSGIEGAVSVGLDFQPYSAGRDYLCPEDGLALDLVRGEEHAEGSSELRDDNSFDSVDDEGSVIGHEREISKKDFLFLFRVEHLVLELDSNLEGGLIRKLVRLCEVLVVLCRRKLEAREGELELLVRIVLDWRELLENVGETLFNEPLERLRLGIYQVRNVRERLLVSSEKFLCAHALIKCDLISDQFHPTFV